MNERTDAAATDGNQPSEGTGKDAPWGDLGFLAEQFTARAAAHDGVADRLATEDSDQALIDSGIAAGYRGAAELAAKHQASTAATLTARAAAVKTIASVLDQWENGALVNRGGYTGIVWVEPLWPLPPRAEEIRAALQVLRSGLASGKEADRG
ncbi:hypothetical protein [Arthrobacter sp. UYCo732]|uniref:hypothetical protein n=1 Tax=Arthrobacter sp. UYCo732 TaxID=3156336 RepID=UPI0033928E26